MSEDNITPAVNLQEEMPNEMSAAEFQRKLYAWFEDRGLLSELRAHLRKQMIGILKDTAIGRTVSGQQKQAISPKLQALNLLIAEFLLQQDYHYSLSVFSTEVPLISVLPEFPGLTMNCTTRKSDYSKKWQFSEKDMWDILETLGVQRDTDEGKHISIAYYNSSSTNKESLLTCIVRMLHTMQISKSRTNLAEIKDVENKNVRSDSNNNSNVWIKNVNELLSSNNVSPQVLDDILKVLKTIIESEKKRLKAEAREDYLKLEISLQLETAKIEEEQRNKFAQIQKSLEFEKTKLQTERTNRQIEANNFASKVHRTQTTLRDRYQQVLMRERVVHERELQVEQKEDYLEEQQQNLEAGYDSLYREQQTVKDLQQRLQRELKEKQEAAKNDVEFLKDLQEECKTMKTQITNTQEAVLNVTGSKTAIDNEQPSTTKTDPEQEAEQTHLKRLISQLHHENSCLKALNSEQQIKVDELSQRAARLTYDLQNIQEMEDAGRRLPRSGILSAPPVVAPAPPSSRTGVVCYSGAGEDGFRPCPPGYRREYRHLPRNGRQRVPPHRLTVHSSSSSDDPSPTNEILLEARERLRRLEQESEEVDRYYRQFRSRQDQFFLKKNLHRSALASWSKDSNNGFGLQYQEGKATVIFDYFNDKDRVVYNTQRDSYQSPPDNNLYKGAVSRNVPAGHYSEDAQNVEENKTLECATPNMEQQNENALRVSHLMEWHSSLGDVNSPQSESEQEEDNAESELKKEEVNEDERLDKRSDNQSVASSGILGDMLAAGTSGVSLSGVETTDEKTESQSENVAE